MKSSGPRSESAHGASTSQRMMWVVEEFSGSAGLLSVPIVMRIRGPLNRQALDRALSGLVSRHEGLRTTFERVGNHRDLRCRVLEDDVAVAFDYVDVSTASDPHKEAYRLMHERLIKRFDLTGMPISTAIYDLGNDDYIALINVYHLVTDAWSNWLIRHELGILYDREIGLSAPQLPPVTWSFSEFLTWRDGRLKGDAGKRHSEYWDSAVQHLKWAGLRPSPARPNLQLPPGKQEDLFIDEESALALRNLAQQEKATTFVSMLALLYSTLYLVTRADRLVVGTIFANRTRREVWNTVGPLANMVVLRIDLPDRPCFRDVLCAARYAAFEGLAHQEYPHTKVVTNQETTPRIVARAVEIVFNMLSAPPQIHGVQGGFDGLQVEPQLFPRGLSTHFNLELLITPQMSGLHGAFRYAGDRYEEPLVQQMATLYTQLARLACQYPAIELTDLPGLSQ